MDFINPESAEKYKKGWDEENKCITTLFTLIKKKKLINVILLECTTTIKISILIINLIGDFFLYI
jgi:hypothetical protein